MGAEKAPPFADSARDGAPPLRKTKQRRKRKRSRQDAGATKSQNYSRSLFGERRLARDDKCRWERRKLHPLRTAQRMGHPRCVKPSKDGNGKGAGRMPALRRAKTTAGPSDSVPRARKPGGRQKRGTSLGMTTLKARAKKQGGATCSDGQVLPDWAQGAGCAWMRWLEQGRLVGAG
jgi:hypothetical protein